MPQSVKPLVFGALIMALLVGAVRTRSQGHGNTFLIPLRDTDAPKTAALSDPQLRRQMMHRYREALQVTSDREWRRISPSIRKVVEARFQIGLTGAGIFGNWRRDSARARHAASDPPLAGPPRVEPAVISPEVQDLQQAIRAQAPAAELERKLERLRKVRQTRKAELHKARADLRKG